MLPGGGVAAKITGIAALPHLVPSAQFNPQNVHFRYLPAVEILYRGMRRRQTGAANPRTAMCAAGGRYGQRFHLVPLRSVRFNLTPWRQSFIGIIVSF